MASLTTLIRSGGASSLMFNSSQGHSDLLLLAKQLPMGQAHWGSAVYGILSTTHQKPRELHDADLDHDRFPAFHFNGVAKPYFAGSSVILSPPFATGMTQSGVAT